VNSRWAITTMFFVDGALFASWSSRIPAYAAHTGASTGALGLALLAPALGAVLAMPVIGRQLAGRSSRSFCQASTAALAMAIVLPGLCRSLPELGAALLLVGIANSTLDVAMNAHGVGVERRLGRPILSTLHAAFSFGGFAGAGLGALAAHLAIAPSLHLLVAGVIFGGGGITASRWLVATDDDPDANSPRVRFARLPGRLMLLGVACLFSFVAEGGAADWSAKLIHDDMAASAATGALAFAAFNLAMGSGRLAADSGFRRWGAVRLLRGGGLLAAVGFGGALAIGGAGPVVAGFALLGLGLSGVAPTLFRSAADEPGVPTPPALAAVSSLGYSGFLAGPPIIGGLAQLTSLRTACFLMAVSGLLVLMLAFAARVPRTVGVR
jgi:hypothetical protein